MEIHCALMYMTTMVHICAMLGSHLLFIVKVVDSADSTRNDPFYWDNDVWTRKCYFIL